MEWEQKLKEAATPASEVVKESPDTLVVKHEAIVTILKTVLDAFINPPDGVMFRGQVVKFQKGNLKNYSIAEQLGYGESFRDNWKRAVVNEKDLAKLLAQWPKFIEAVTIDPPEALKDINEVTTGEVDEFATGFCVYAKAKRLN